MALRRKLIRPPREPRFGLSGKLLVLTILFVMMAEVLIYVPSVANFRLTWLRDKLAAAHTAALVLDAAPSGMVPESLARQILNSIGARAVAMKVEQQRRLLAVSDMPEQLHREFDMRDVSWVSAIVDAFHAMTDPRDAVLRVIGPAPRGGEFVEIVIDNAPLQHAFVEHSCSVADHFRDHRGSRLSRAAYPVCASNASHHRQHDLVRR
jgi:hypothetical protein